MNKKLAKFFAVFSSIDCSVVPEHQLEDDMIQQESDLDSVLKEIFAVDTRTGLPKGDIQYFLSKDGNPQVKAFIESALFAPRNPQGMFSPEQITDDLIVECSRMPDESIDDYAARLDKFRSDAMAEYEKAKSELNSLSV